MNSALLGDRIPDHLMRCESPDQIEKGDTVYEVVSFGSRPENVKFIPHKVARVESRTVLVRRPESSSDAKAYKLTLGSILIEKPVPPSVMPAPTTKLSLAHVQAVRSVAIAEKKTPAGDAFEAYLEMSRDLLTEIDAERAQLTSQKQHIRQSVEGIEANWRKRIEKLETELLQAKASAERDRNLAATGLAALEEQLAAVDGRRELIEDMLARASGKATL